MIARRERLIGSSYGVMEGEERVASIQGRFFSSALDVTGAVGNLAIEKAGWLSGEYRLVREGSVIARAFKTGIFSRAVEIQFDGRSVTMNGAGFLSSERTLYEGGEYRGRIATVGFFGGGIEVEVQESVPREIQVFALGLVILWKREDASASST